MSEFEIPWTKDQLRDSSGRPLTQSLFLEFGYNTQYAVFTLNEEDKVYKDKLYPSLKKWYLKVEDPTEYQFANTCLLNWNHWIRLCENKMFTPYVEDWRDELEVAMRSSALRAVIDQSENNFQAAKFLTEKGWDKRGVGRPSKAVKERERVIQDRIGQVLEDNIVRMDKYVGE